MSEFITSENTVVEEFRQPDIQNASDIQESNSFDSLKLNISNSTLFKIIEINEIQARRDISKSNNPIIGRYNNKNVFVKEFNFNLPNELTLLEVKRELKAAELFKDQSNFIQTLGILFKDNNIIGLVQEYPSDDNLENYLFSKNDSIPFKTKLKWSNQICSALNTLVNQAKYVHRNVHPTNILVFGDDVKLCNFNWMFPLHLKTKFPIISFENPHFSIPDSLSENNRYGESSEVFCLGLVLTHLFTLVKINETEIDYINYVTKVFDSIEQNDIIPIEKLSTIKNICLGCIQPTIENRKKLSEIHSEIQSILTEDELRTTQTNSTYLDKKPEIMLLKHLKETNLLKSIDNIHIEIVQYYELLNDLIDVKHDEALTLTLASENLNKNYVLNKILSANNIALLKRLLEKKFYIFNDFLDYKFDGLNYYLSLCKENKYELLQLLLTEFKDKLTKEHFEDNGPDNRNALLLVCRYGYIETFKTLFQENFYQTEDIGRKNSRGRNAFMFACEHNHLNLIQNMIEDPEISFKDLSICTDNGRNGFMLACRSGNLEVVKYLIENKHCPFQDLLAEDKDCYTAYSIAKSNKKPEIHTYLSTLNVYKGLANKFGTPHVRHLVKKFFK